MLPGVAVTFQGEEIGMLNNMDISYSQTVDPRGCNCGPELFNASYCSRDPERTPMQWSNDPNAGFTGSGVTPWLPVRFNYVKMSIAIHKELQVNPNYVDLNVKAQWEATESHIKVYQSLSQLRKNAALKEGIPTISAIDTVFAFSRSMSDTPIGTIIVAVNTANRQTEINLSNLDKWNVKRAVVRVRSIGSQNSMTQIGNEVDLTAVTLQPYEAIVAEIVTGTANIGQRPTILMVLLLAVFVAIKL